MPDFVMLDFLRESRAYLIDNPAWLLLLSGIVLWMIGAALTEAQRRARWMRVYKRSHRLYLSRSSETWRKLQREAHARRAAELRAVATRMQERP